MRLATFPMEKAFILYDADSLCDAGLTPQIAPSWFTVNQWQEAGAILGQATGRGTSLFVLAGQQEWVIRPYRRGGMVARISECRYIWTGRERTRAFRELRLTERLYRHGLPVPRPIAGCVWRHGLTYEATLITERLNGVRSLADSLPALDDAMLQNIGVTLRRFHVAGLDHVDLNARNLLIDDTGGVWLIDLDRCRLRRPGRWQQANLKRLERSLTRFVNDDVRSVMEKIENGYHSH
ncbi:3-deoxy-D-manno-octulosonic acid kinase [Aidingimonas lacisalsi]|uniref:3-deoxy-D-manno-octulosonic acid kinase n=1 Tax=Aidingimonas lacisalsi TaxID=2604086 RepID=UPI0011D22BA9|nr:3-deoxy-D-manno-octulosonic acid kinase [Aidingimonas lacisalsi]